jgi:TonB-linked SusC/RagA family outer membrane protein
MKSKFTWIFTLLLAFFIQFSFAQEKTITGVVSDANGMPIPGVTVMVEGAAPGVQTDFDGKYSISASQGQRISFSYVGMKTQIVTVGASSSVSIRLQDDVTLLDDVVVEAYRTTTRATSNVASTTVTSKTIENRPNASFMQTLQGQIPGLNISTGSGQPGSNNTTVILRGVGSINGNIEPLYVIDGVPQNSDNFRSINPNDIESISVLKDAGATSIYGNRGANGVIIVKTKRGGYESKLAVRYSSTTGFTYLQDNDYDLMNSQELLRLERAYGSGRGVGMSDADIDATPTTDWLDVFFRTGVSQNHTLSLTSGSKNLSAFTTIGYFDQEGILQNTDLKRFNFRSNINGKSDNDRLNYATSITANFSRTNSASNLGTGAVNQNYLVGALQGVPYLSPSDYTTGAALVGSASLTNTPLFLLDKLRTFTNQAEEIRAIGQGQISYKFTPEITAGTSLGIDYTGINGLTVQGPEGFNSLYFAAQDADGNTIQEFVGDQSESFSRNVSFNTNTYITYSKLFAEKHTIEVSAFTEYFKAHFKSLGYTQNGLDPIFSEPGTGGGFIPYQSGNNFYVPGASSGKSEAGLFSYFGSADYDYDARYGLSATVRRDASFRFADTNQWGTFWSVSARWNIDKEAFMEGSVFNMLKLRGSFGTAGNQDITGGGVFAGASLTRFQYGIGSGYNNGPSYTLGGLANPTLKWETIEQANIGLDFSVFDSKLTGTFDVYQKTTKDLYQGVPLSAINATTEINANFGSLRNRGIEAQVSYAIVRNSDFNLSVNFNGSYNKNELLELPSDNGTVWDGGLLINREGDILNQYYLVEYAGVNPANGNLLFYDRNGALTETPTDNDRKFTDKSLIPKYQGGFGLDAEYKGFFLTTMFTYVADVYRFDYDLQGFQDPDDIGLFNKSRDLNRAWTPDNRVTDIPSLRATNLSLESFSDRNLKDASYLRMRYLTLGYSFSPELLDKTPFGGIRAFVQAENLLTWSKWRGLDAESNRAADQAQYPTPKIVSLGLELEF